MNKLINISIERAAEYRGEGYTLSGLAISMSVS